MFSEYWVGYAGVGGVELHGLLFEEGDGGHVLEEGGVGLVLVDHI